MVILGGGRDGARIDLLVWEGKFNQGGEDYHVSFRSDSEKGMAKTPK